MGFGVLGLLLALLVLKKNVWTDLIVAITLTICCFVLWGFTVITEKRQAQAIAKQRSEVSRFAL